MVVSTVSTATQSQRIIAEMMALNPSVRRSGFAKAMREMFEWPEIGEIAKTIIPDGFHVSQGRQEVTIIEVDDTHPINAFKASKIGDLADALLEEDWDLVVVVVDYAGNIKAAVPGWCFMPVYTEPLTPPGCRDLTPAAIAVHRKASKSNE